MNATSQDTATTPQHPNAPFGKLGLVERPAGQGGCYIGDCAASLSIARALLSPATP